MNNINKKNNLYTILFNACKNFLEHTNGTTEDIKNYKNLVASFNSLVQNYNTLELLNAQLTAQQKQNSEENIEINKLVKTLLAAARMNLQNEEYNNDFDIPDFENNFSSINDLYNILINIYAHFMNHNALNDPMLPIYISTQLKNVDEHDLNLLKEKIMSIEAVSVANLIISEINLEILKRSQVNVATQR